MVIIMNNILDILKNTKTWSIPEIGQDIPHGDMPGDKVDIGQDHINKSEIVFRELLKKLPVVFESSESSRAVITVCGGSGVGKSEIASLISYYLNQLGIGSYTLSGDNYPRRIPKYNDAERLRIFRQSGVRALVEADMLNADIYGILRELQEKDEDADKNHIEKHPWFKTYLDGAIGGLKGYLGTKNEIDFDEITDIVKQFKAGSNEIWLKRMGRTECDLWYEKVDFSKISVLVIEWTHGNSDNYEGVDIPVLLNSTPEETLAHRRSRNRDGKTDSPFTMRVLEIEQQMLDTQAHKAKIIISKSGELLTYDEYKALMAASK
jgi:alpha-galactosidase